MTKNFNDKDFEEALAKPDFWEGYVPEPVSEGRALKLAMAEANDKRLEAQQEPVCIGWDDKTDTLIMGYTSPPAQPVQDNPLDCGVYLGSGKDHEIKHHVSYGPEPVDILIAAWQALEETSGHVLDEGDVEGRMHMSVIRSAWEQMDSLVRDLWDERGRK